MDCNVKELELTRNYREDKDAHGGYRESLTIRFRLDDMEHSIAPMLHSAKAIGEYVDRLRGIVPWHEAHAYNDVTYWIDGLTFLHASLNEPAEHHYMDFPRAILADAIERLSVSERRKEARRVFTPEELDRISKEHAPRIRVVFRDGCQADYLKIVHGEWGELVSEKDCERVRADLRALTRWAKNYSNGQQVTLTISRDHYDAKDRPMSFYWYISDATHPRFVNGGLIAHPRYASEPAELEYYKRPIVAYEYSMHT